MDDINREFMKCIEDNNLSAVTVLLELGANVRAQIDHALQWSAEYGNLDIVLKLLDHNADIQVEQRETWKRKW